jgi:hypothetical protein
MHPSTLSRNRSFSSAVSTVYGGRRPRRLAPEDEHRGEDNRRQRENKSEANDDYADVSFTMQKIFAYDCLAPAVRVEL